MRTGMLDGLVDGCEGDGGKGVVIRERGKELNVVVVGKRDVIGDLLVR